MEQEKLQSMINSIVRLSAPAGGATGMCSDLVATNAFNTQHGFLHANQISAVTRILAAGGIASETASPAKEKTKKRKKRPQKEPGHVSHISTQDGTALVSEQAVPKATNETSRPADGQRQPELGKRKAIEQGAQKAKQEQPSTRSEAQPLPAPASEAGQQEGARKKRRRQKSKGEGLGQEQLKHSRVGTTHSAASLPTVAAATGSKVLPLQSQEGAGRGKPSQPGAQQRPPSSLVQDSAPSAQASEPVRKKWSRNKFKQDAAAGQSGLPSGANSAPEAQAPDAVRKKRNRNKFKQAEGTSQQALPESSMPKVAVHKSMQDDAAVTLGGAKKQDSASQQRLQPVLAALQHDKHSEKLAGKHIKGSVAGHKGKAAGLIESSKDAGKAKKSDATLGSQVARAGVKGHKEDGLLSKMRAKLSGSQFRWLNEQLYTCPGSQAFELMQEQPQLFTQYHEVRSVTITALS